MFCRRKLWTVKNAYPLLLAFNMGDWVRGEAQPDSLHIWAILLEQAYASRRDNPADMVTSSRYWNSKTGVDAYKTLWAWEWNLKHMIDQFLNFKHVIG